jgi:hypothetical protein
MTAQAFEPRMQSRVRIAIHQPNFFPRLKVLQKIASADIWCVLDSVQYCAREWQNRTRIVATHGDNQAFWFSVPVRRPHGRNTLISDVSIVNPSLTAPLAERTLFHAFKQSPYWSTIKDLLSNLRPLLAADSLARLCVDTTCLLLRIAGRQPTLIFASSLPVKGKASTLMAAICRYLNATTYLADSGGRNYLQPAHFREMEVLWQNWCEPPEKLPGISSWRNISSVNYLARLGPEQFTRQIRNGEFIPDPSWPRPCPT